MFKNVVVGIRDAETGPDAIALAGQLTSSGGGLTLVHVREVGDSPAADSGTMRAASLRRHWVARLAGLAEACSIDATVACVEAHSPRRGLHEFAAARNADLLVVRATGRDEVERDLVADDARLVLEAAPCAVAVAPRGYRAGAGPIRRIGVGYDGSAESRQALSLGRTLAGERDAELAAFEVVSTPVYVHDSWEMRDEIDRSVTRARERITALGGLEAEAGFGDRVDELTRFAESVDLLILGAHRYTLPDRLLERSTAQLLADRTPSPLLVLAAPSE
jgi:nucleotide-binding universal stress UspA family protein